MTDFESGRQSKSCINLLDLDESFKWLDEIFRILSKLKFQNDILTLYFSLFYSDLEKQVDVHENQLVEIDQQQKNLLANVRRDTEILEKQRKSLSDELTKEKEIMKVLENRMEELRKLQLINGSLQPEVDFLAETESEGESLSEQTRTCSELEASLSRLALLDKTQQEIDQISVATETMLSQSELIFFTKKKTCFKTSIFHDFLQVHENM